MTQGVWEENPRTSVYILLPTDKKEIKLYEYLICFASNSWITDRYEGNTLNFFFLFY